MENKLILFTVIVPVYNTEKCISHCVESILAQDYQNFELILIDDGSTDTSGLICDKYVQIDSRIRVIHKSNGGIASVRNLGIAEAKGEWITFCDSDDFVYRGWLSTFADNCTDVDMVCQGIRFDYSQSNFQNLQYKDVSFNYNGDALGYVLKTYEKNVVGYTTIKCFKKELLEQSGLQFEQANVPREDEEFVLRYMTLCERAISVVTVGYHYYVPDFNIKYASYKNNMLLAKTLFCNALNLYRNQFNAHVKDYLNSYTGVLVKTFLRSCSVCELKKYKQVVGELVYETGLPSLIKKIIHCDHTLILSSVTLFLYSLYINIKTNKNKKIMP